MPKDPNIRKVMVIGSGPIVIGQAAEFDYAGAQACRVLREEGVNVVLVNSNPATIMTDHHLADEIYLEALNKETIRRIKSEHDWLVSESGYFCRWICSVNNHCPVGETIMNSGRKK